MLQLQLLFKSNKITYLLRSLLSCQMCVVNSLTFYGNKILMTVTYKIQTIYNSAIV